jgi:hypothetical protein
MPEFSPRRRKARVSPYLALPPDAPLSTPGASSASRALLHRVLNGLRSLPDRGPVHPPPQSVRDDRSPLVRFIDAERARTVVDRTPTEEIPVVGEGVSGR